MDGVRWVPLLVLLDQERPHLPSSARGDSWNEERKLCVFTQKKGLQHLQCH